MKKIVVILMTLLLMFGCGLNYSVIADQNELSNPIFPGVFDKQVEKYDTLYFGKCYQSNYTYKEPIKWIVLKVSGDDVWCVSEKYICETKDEMNYNEKGVYSYSWWDRNDRKYLNEDFCNEAFSAEEKKSLIAVPFSDCVEGDLVYLPSSDEIITYKNVFLKTSNQFTQIALHNDRGGKAFSILTLRETYDGVYWSEYENFPGTISSFLNEDDVNEDYYVRSVWGAFVFHLKSTEKEYPSLWDCGSGLKPMIHIKKSSKLWKKGNPIGTNLQFFNPGQTQISKINAKKRKLIVKWKGLSSSNGVDGYQIQYSLKKNFKKVKTVNINKAGTKSKTIKKLRSKKKYYVRIRTFSKVDKYYYSAWSKVKSKKTK